MCDDIAAMFPPSIWEEFVLPYWEQYFRGITSGKRRVHCEDLTVGHMYLMEKAFVSAYDAGISYKINPEIICENTRVPFYWQMGSFQLKELNSNEIEDWVYKAVGDGASMISLENDMIDSVTVEKVKTFIRVCMKVEKLLNEGATRERIADLVSHEGKERFWKQWSR